MPPLNSNIDHFSSSWPVPTGFREFLGSVFSIGGRSRFAFVYGTIHVRAPLPTQTASIGNENTATSNHRDESQSNYVLKVLSDRFSEYTKSDRKQTAERALQLDCDCLTAGHRTTERLIRCIEAAWKHNLPVIISVHSFRNVAYLFEWHADVVDPKMCWNIFLVEKYGSNTRILLSLSRYVI